MKGRSVGMEACISQTAESNVSTSGFCGALFRNLRLRSFSFGFFALLAPGIAPASNISMDIKAASVFTKGRVSVNLEISNRGDESAKSAWVAVSLGTNTVRGETRKILATNESFRVNLDLGAAPEIPGIYMLPIRVHYEDLNGYPSTASTTVPLITGEPGDISDSLTASLSSSAVVRNGELVLDLSVRGKDSINASLTLVAPDELSCITSDSLLRLVPGTDGRVAIKIRNLSALNGSSYPVTAIMDYVDKGFHRSITATGVVKIGAAGGRLFCSVIVWSIVAGVLMAVFAVMQFIRRPVVAGSAIKSGRLDFEHAFDSFCTIAVLSVILGFTLYNIPAKYLLMDTTITGGDTPAHNYMASHLHEQLFHHGRIVSWANGWWCGFPMFQFYFCLPYLLVALLSVVIPFNIAFKLVSVLGIFLLPACAYTAGRIMRLPRPIPVLMSIAAVPFLFVRAHDMWGGNIYSTFAGMIANSISFPLMLLFIASSWRDADDGKFRLRTTALLVLLLASHFFTSVVGGLCVAIIPFLRPKAGIGKAIITLVAEYTLAVLLMAWWLIPLVAKSEFTMDFGTNWNIDLMKTIPAYWLWPLLFLAGFAVVQAIVLRISAVLIFFWMMFVSVALFYFGFDHVARVFVNARLWPFVFFSLLSLAAVGAGFLLETLRFKGVACLAVLVTTLTFGIAKPNDVLSWTKWNYEGLEQKPRWQAFSRLTARLSMTPGRLANDLHADNNSLGSSRVFECVPHLAGKPILEGGLVNSSAGSIYSYYIQSESSESCAGFPDIVTPVTFNFDNATRHLELFNVKHFIARGDAPQKALASSKSWKFIDEVQGWQLYELLSNDGRYVSVPAAMPMAVRIDSRDKDNWKKAGLEWIYSIKLIDQPFVFLRKGEPSESVFKVVMDENEFLKYCRLTRGENVLVKPLSTIPHDKISISNEEVTDNRIRFRTNAIGLPHMIKCTYFPNWKVKGAKKVFMVTPCFMLVYPEQTDVELYYGYTTADNIGRGLSVIGLFLAVAWLWRARHKV